MKENDKDLILKDPKEWFNSAKLKHDQRKLDLYEWFQKKHYDLELDWTSKLDEAYGELVKAGIIKDGDAPPWKTK